MDGSVNRRVQVRRRRKTVSGRVCIHREVYGCGADRRQTWCRVRESLRSGRARERGVSGKVDGCVRAGARARVMHALKCECEGLIPAR